MRATLSAALLFLLSVASLRAATISGNVRDLDGNGIPNVQVNLTGSLSRFAVTDAAGAYIMTSITLTGNYTLTPVKTGLVFTPVSRSTAVMTGDWTGQDFTYGKTWTGAGPDALASDAANWDSGIAPIYGDFVRFASTGATIGCLWDLTLPMSGIQFQSTYSSSVVAGVDMTLGSVFIAGGEFLTGSHEINISKDFAHTGGRFRSGAGGTAFFNGIVVQTVSMIPGSLGGGLYDSYFSGFRVASSSTVKLGSEIIVDGTFNISSGRFDMQTSSLTLTGGTQNGQGGAFNWDDSGGTLLARSGGVTFDSRAGGTFQLRQAPTNSFNNITAAGSSSLSMLSAISLNGSLRVNQIDGNPVVNLGSGFTHTFNGVVVVGPTAAPGSNALILGVSTAVFKGGVIIGTATVAMQSGHFQLLQSTLQITDQGQLLVAGGQTGEFVFYNKTNLALRGGTLRILGNSVFRSSAPAAARFSTDLNGTLDIEAPCTFDSLDANGFQLESSAQPLHLDDLSFLDGPPGGAALNFNPPSVANVTVNSPSFDASISTNARAVVDSSVVSNPSITIVLASGGHAGPAFEYDPSNVIHWGQLGTPAGFGGAFVGVSSITWSWTIVSHPLGFYVVSDTGAVMSPALDADTTSWIETGLSVNTRYTRFVRAFTDAAQADSSQAAVFTAAAVPGNVGFGEIVVSSLTVAWDANFNPPPTLFDVDRSTDNVSFTRLVQGTYASIEPYSDTGLVPQRNYFYRIKAENGDSFSSAAVTISTSTLPVPPPSAFSVTPSTVPNLGVVRFTVRGAHIQNGAALRIRRAGPVTIEAQNVTVLDPNTIQGSVSLTGVFATNWDVEIENPDEKLSIGTGAGILTVADALSTGVITVGNYTASTPLALPSTDDKTLVSLAAGAFASGRLYISVDPQNVPLAVSPSMIASATSALKNWILIPGTVREILAFTAQAPFTSGFATPVSLGISFPDADHDGVIDSVRLRRATLRMFTLNQTTGEWELLPTSSIDIANNRVNAPLSHFSVYALFGSPAAADLSQAKVYPSPWKPNSKGPFDATHLTFSDLTESGQILVYNTSAKLLKSLTFNATESGVITWDGIDDQGKALPSGMYLVFIKSSTGTKVALKFGVER